LRELRKALDSGATDALRALIETRVDGYHRQPKTKSATDAS
jgi:hypothetical protein